MNGALGDPFAPVIKDGAKSFTLAGRDFDYRTLTDLLLSGDWTLPVLAHLDKAIATARTVSHHAPSTTSASAE